MLEILKKYGAAIYQRIPAPLKKLGMYLSGILEIFGIFTLETLSIQFRLSMLALETHTYYLNALLNRYISNAQIKKYVKYAMVLSIMAAYGYLWHFCFSHLFYFFIPYFIPPGSYSTASGLYVISIIWDVLCLLAAGALSFALVIEIFWTISATLSYICAPAYLKSRLYISKIVKLCSSLPAVHSQKQISDLEDKLSAYLNTFTSLDFSNGFLGDSFTNFEMEDKVFLLGVLSTNKTIQSLNIHWNEFYDCFSQSPDLLIKLLENTTLKECIFSTGFVSYDMQNIVFDKIANNTNLRRIALDIHTPRDTYRPRFSPRLVVETLERNTCLKKFDTLDHNAPYYLSPTIPQAKAYLNLLQTHPTLCSLRFMCPPLTDANATPLITLAPVETLTYQEVLKTIEAVTHKALYPDLLFFRDTPKAQLILFRQAYARQAASVEGPALGAALIQAHIEPLVILNIVRDYLLGSKRLLKLFEKSRQMPLEQVQDTASKKYIKND